MKKKILGITMAIAIVAVAGWNFAQQSENITLSDASLNNIEALAGETGVGLASLTLPCFDKYGNTKKDMYSVTCYVSTFAGAKCTPKRCS